MASDGEAAALPDGESGDAFIDAGEVVDVDRVADQECPMSGTRWVMESGKSVAAFCKIEVWHDEG